jgi:hypothetical protein
VPGQLTIDFCCDERSQMLAREIAIMLAPHLAPGSKVDAAKLLAGRVALLAEKRFRDFQEPTEQIRCHTCDEMTVIGNRVRVVVCNRCSLEGRSPGSRG